MLFLLLMISAYAAEKDKQSDTEAKEWTLVEKDGGYMEFQQQRIGEKEHESESKPDETSDGKEAAHSEDKNDASEKKEESKSKPDEASHGKEAAHSEDKNDASEKKEESKSKPHEASHGKEAAHSEDKNENASDTKEQKKRLQSSAEPEGSSKNEVNAHINNILFIEVAKGQDKSEDGSKGSDGSWVKEGKDESEHSDNFVSKQSQHNVKGNSNKEIAKEVTKFAFI